MFSCMAVLLRFPRAGRFAAPRFAIQLCQKSSFSIIFWAGLLEDGDLNGRKFMLWLEGDCSGGEIDASDLSIPDCHNNHLI